MTDLVKKIREAFFRFPRCGMGQPTRLHVSPDIYRRLLDTLKDDPHQEMDGDLYFKQRPVHKITDLEGFRWVRERPNAWDIGEIHRER